jgi:hypothetical protein
MNDPVPDSSGNTVLADLEAVLKSQLEMMQKGQVEQVHLLTIKSAELLRRLDADQVAQNPAAVEKARELLRKITLTLSQQKAEAAASLGKISKGKTALKAYSGRR